MSADTWQTIDSAPKANQVAYWVSSDRGFMEPVNERHGRWYNCYTRVAIAWSPSHWQPLPAPVGSGQTLADAPSKSPVEAEPVADWSYAFDGSTLRDRFGGSFMAAEPDENGNVSVLMSKDDAHAVIAALSEIKGR